MGVPITTPIIMIAKRLKSQCSQIKQPLSNIHPRYRLIIRPIIQGIPDKNSGILARLCFNILLIMEPKESGRR